MKVVAHVGPEPQTFKIECGDGTQTFKWLALAAAQRYRRAVRCPFPPLRARCAPTQPPAARRQRSTADFGTARASIGARDASSL